MTRDEVIAALRQMTHCLHSGECDGCPHEDSDCIGLDGMMHDKTRAAHVMDAAISLLESAPAERAPVTEQTSATAPAAEPTPSIPTDLHKLLAGLDYCRTVEDCDEDCPIRAECHAATGDHGVPAIGILTLAAEAIRAQLAERSTDTPAADMINHPPHYTYGKHECIDEMEILFGREAVIAYCRCAAYKYKYRAGHKDDAAQDYAKADWYIDKAAELLAKPNLKGS